MIATSNQHPVKTDCIHGKSPVQPTLIECDGAIELEFLSIKNRRELI